MARICTHSGLFVRELRWWSQKGRTVHCHFQGLARQTGRQRWCHLHHHRIVSLAQPAGEVHLRWSEDPVAFSLRFMWKAETFRSFLEQQEINCSQSRETVLYGASVIDGINK